MEMKLVRVLDETVTNWSEDIDDAKVTEAITRTF